jgi:hypothetical protein
MTGRIVHIECGLPPSRCTCPASITRPLRCVVEQLDTASRGLGESLAWLEDQREPDGAA